MGDVSSFLTQKLVKITQNAITTIQINFSRILREWVLTLPLQLFYHQILSPVTSGSTLLIANTLSVTGDGHTHSFSL